MMTTARASGRRMTGRALALPLVEHVAALRERSASRLSWHAHDAFEALFVLDGATAYEFAGGATVELPGGHYLIVPPGVRHRGLHEVRRPTRLCGILFDPRRRSAERHTTLTKRDLDWMHRRCTGETQPRPMSAELRRLVAALTQQIGASSPDGPQRAALRTLVVAVLLEAVKQLDARPTLPRTRTVEAAIEYLEANFSEPVRMDRLAAAVGCSRARLFPIFKQAVGLTPNGYLQRLRIGRAEAALRSGDRSVTEIALACGFSTSQYFSNVFRKLTGTTPKSTRVSSASAVHHRPPP